MTVLITLITAGSDTGPFDLYSDFDGYTVPFETGVSKASLQAGYSTVLVPDTATTVKVQSTGTCDTFVEASLVFPITTTSTTSTTSTTTSTTTVAPPITSSTIALISQGVAPVTGSTNPYPDGGGTFNYAVGVCNVDFSTPGSNFVPGDTLTVQFQSFSTFGIRQCAHITGGTNTPSGIQALPNLTLTEITVQYLAGSPIIQIILYTPTTQLQPSTSASSTMRLLRRNGVAITFPSAFDQANLVTPTSGAVTITVS